MPSPHEVYSLDGTTLSSLGVTGVAVLTDASEVPYLEPEYVERRDVGNLRTATLLPDAELVCVIPCPSWSVIQAVVRQFDWPKNTNERTLAIYVGDPSSLVLGEQSVTISSVVMSPGMVEARVRIADPLWAAQTATVARAAFTANGNLAVTNGGLASAYPTLTVTPTSNTGRATAETATVGWKYRRAIGPITNNSDEDWHEVLMPVWIGDTTGLVSGSKALASGNDVRVWSETGRVVRRQLQNWNSLASSVIFPVTIPAGESATYWLVYGNPQAVITFAGDPEYLDLDTRGGIRDGYAAPDLYATTGATTGASTTTVVTISPSPGWETNRLAGGWAYVVSGTGSGATAIRRIASNTANTYTVDDAYETAPTSSTVAIWLSGTAMEGVIPTAATSTTVTDSSKLWATDQWEHGYAYIASGTGSGQTREILSNTGTVITTAAWSPTPDTTSRIVLVKPGYQSYMVDRTIFDTLWRGLWRLSNYYESPKHKPRYGDRCPAAWTPFTRFLNEDNYAQPSSNDYGSGGGHSQNWFTNGRIRRQVRQDRHYGEHKQADGFRLTDPRGIDLVTFDYQWKNVGGICKFFLGAQTGDAVDFMDLVTNSTTQASLTDVAVQSVDLTGYEEPVTTLSFNVGPSDGVLIPNDTDAASEAEWRTKSIMRLWISPDLIGGRDATYGYLTVGSEVEGYQAETRLSLNGRIVQLGGVGRRTLVPLGDDLVVRCDPDTQLPWCAIYDPFAATNATGTDAFTAFGGTALETYDADWVKHSASGAGSVTINGNRIHNTNTSAMHLYYRSDWTPAAGAHGPAADYDVAADIVLITDNNLCWMGVAGRIDTSADTAYYAIYATSANAWQLWKVVAGTPTQLSSNYGQVLTASQAYALRLVMRGSFLRVFVDGLLVISAVDTAITAAGRAGIRTADLATSSTGVHLDNWAAYQGSGTLSEWTGHAVRFLETKTDLESASVELVATKLLALPTGNSNLAVSETAIGQVTVAAEWYGAYLG